MHGIHTTPPLPGQPDRRQGTRGGASTRHDKQKQTPGKAKAKAAKGWVASKAGRPTGRPIKRLRPLAAWPRPSYVSHLAATSHPPVRRAVRRVQLYCMPLCLSSTPLRDGCLTSPVSRLFPFPFQLLRGGARRGQPQPSMRPRRNTLVTVAASVGPRIGREARPGPGWGSEIRGSDEIPRRPHILYPSSPPSCAPSPPCSFLLARGSPPLLRSAPRASFSAAGTGNCGGGGGLNPRARHRLKPSSSLQGRRWSIGLKRQKPANGPQGRPWQGQGRQRRQEEEGGERYSTSV